MKSIPDLIKVEFRLNSSRIARLAQDLADLQRDVARLRDLPEKVDAIPRVLTQLLAEDRNKD